MQAKGKVEKGKLILADKAAFIQGLRKLNGEVVVTVKEGRLPRSVRQNAYFHGVVLKLLSEETGHDVKFLKEYLNETFLEKEEIELKFVNKETGEVFRNSVEYSQGSSDLNTKEFEEYMSKIRIWASQELGIFIPEPNENYDYLSEN